MRPHGMSLRAATILVLALAPLALCFQPSPCLQAGPGLYTRRKPSLSNSEGGSEDPPTPWRVGPEVQAAFPELSMEQWRQVETLSELLIEWNSRINIVSRKDIQNVGPNHILPALGLATLLQGAPKGTTIIDVGTGGGFPGLPLAIACPQAKLLLTDSVGKKIQAVTDMAERLGLTNVVTRHGRVEEVTARFDYVVGRSVTALPKFLKLVQSKLAIPPLSDRTLNSDMSKDADAGMEEAGTSSKGRRLVPEKGVLYITGVEPLDDSPEPAALWPVTELLPNAYVGDKAVWHFKSTDLLTDDTVRATKYDERGVFRPKGEGLEWKMRKFLGPDEENQEEFRDRRRGPPNNGRNTGRQDNFRRREGPAGEGGPGGNRPRRDR